MAAVIVPKSAVHAKSVLDHPRHPRAVKGTSRTTAPRTRNQPMVAASARSTRVGHAAAASLARLRGGQVFALAFLFRVQSQLLGWGALVNILKVDILNVMGLSLLVLSPLGALSTKERIRFSAVLGAVIACLAPLVSLLDLTAIPEFLRHYLVPDPLHFGIFPWASFTRFDTCSITRPDARPINGTPR